MADSTDKDLIVMHGEIRTPPMSRKARIEAGFLLRKIQQGDLISMPHSRPMPSIGAHCHELRTVDEDSIWRIVYRIDADAVLILEVFRKKTRETPQNVINSCRRRIRSYDSE